MDFFCSLAVAAVHRVRSGWPMFPYPWLKEVRSNMVKTVWPEIRERCRRPSPPAIEWPASVDPVNCVPGRKASTGTQERPW